MIAFSLMSAEGVALVNVCSGYLHILDVFYVFIHMSCIACACLYAVYYICLFIHGVYILSHTRCIICGFVYMMYYMYLVIQDIACNYLYMYYIYNYSYKMNYIY